jgi:alpha-L-rhamnosidase
LNKKTVLAYAGFYFLLFNHSIKLREMKKGYCLLLLMLTFRFFASAQLMVQNLLTENLTNPIGIDARQPRFSWQLISDKNNIMQSAFEIRVSAEIAGKGDVWTSGKITSDQSVEQIYGGGKLVSGKKYFWQVRVTDNTGKTSPWSTPAFFEMGLLDADDWKAKWISPGYQEALAMQPSPLFRKEFQRLKKIKSATLHITAHGLYEARINGLRVGKAFLTPGWTSYNKRLPYQTYDVTDLIKDGKNAIAVLLGSGWYRGHLAWADNKNIYGKDISLLLQLAITYTDGKTENIVSDESWKSSSGEIISSEIYDGENIDLRKRKTGWELAGYDESGWYPVKTGNFPLDKLYASNNEPITKHETFKPLKIITTARGEKVMDFGQNLVGWVVVKVKGAAGDKITISHAEVLDKEENFYTENLRLARAQDSYILQGTGEEVVEPHFTFHGFRYIKVEGYPGELKPEDFTAVALYSDMPETGTFTSSNPLINQLQHNIQWGQRGNFLDVPTDCPQRDERLGWTGDAQVFSRTAAFNMGVNNFFAKWLKDVAADQNASGSVPFVVPNVLDSNAAGSTGWADVATIIPWNMYLAYGDKKLLEEQYNSMKAWVDFMQHKSKNDLWNTGFHFGDWLFYRPEDDNDGRSAVTDKYLIAQCFYAHSTQLLINAASVLGKTEDSNSYTRLLEKIKDAFVKEYMTANGRLVSGTQTAYTLALNFDMLPENLRKQAAQKLVDNIKDYGYHLTTGFLGTPYLCHVLSRFGFADIAFRLLLQDSYPSWLYPVRMGATTIWERWDGIKPDSTFETPAMNSYNHYSYGAIGDWMYRVVAGIDCYEDGPGYKHIMLMPHPGGGFTNVRGDLQTYYGKISSSWKIENGQIIFDLEVPANTKAEIFIPAPGPDAITYLNKKLGIAKDIEIKGTEDGYVHIHTGSGKYLFRVNQ